MARFNHDIEGQGVTLAVWLTDNGLTALVGMLVALCVAMGSRHAWVTACLLLFITISMW